MTRLCLVLAAAGQLSLAAASGSMRMELAQRGDTLARSMEVRAENHGEEELARLGVPYDPALQSVVLLYAETRAPGGEWVPLPEWARERVDGSGGYPRSLQLAFTGLQPGDSLRWGLVQREWGPRSAAGPWMVLPPPAGMATVEVYVERPPSGVRWAGEGWTAEEEGGGLLLRSETAARDTLWLTSLQSWRGLGRLMLAGVPEAPPESLPPDLREAALQASSAGADPWSQLCLARTLLTESFQIMHVPSPPSSWRVRSLQRILDSRRATPLELAALLSAMCSVLEMEAEVVPATGFRPVLPVPAGWDRFLLRVRSGRRSWLVDPAAALAQSDHVPDGERLWMLRISADTVTAPPEEPSTASLCLEEWTLDPGDGTFTLSLYCRGDYDAVLRRRLAGLAGREDEAALSLWLWQSGTTCIVDTVEYDESLFRLERPVEVSVGGRLGYSGTPLLLPAVDWSLDGARGEIHRTWRLPGGLEAPDSLLRSSGDGWILLGSEGPLPPRTVVVGR